MRTGQSNEILGEGSIFIEQSNSLFLVLLELGVVDPWSRANGDPGGVLRFDGFQVGQSVDRFLHVHCQECQGLGRKTITSGHIFSTRIVM